MNVELAEERIFLLPARLTAEEAETRAWAKRTDAFGAFAKLGGLLSKQKDEAHEIVYRELRLQPFWRLSASTEHVYERDRPHKLKLATEVQSVTIAGQSFPAASREASITVTECCRESSRREWFFDGLSKAALPTLKNYLTFDPRPATADELNEQARTGAVILPPLAKASMLTRDVISQAIKKIEADRVIEEKMQIDAIELYYRPVHAIRYRWQAKEAVVEVDALTGDAKPGGATFESYVGKLVDPAFLLDAGAEAANMLIPGVNLAKMFVTKLNAKT